MAAPLFPPTTPDAWRAAAEASLKGKAFDSLVRTTEDGIERGPLFREREGEDAPARSSAATPPPAFADRAWHIVAPVRARSPAKANAQLLEDLLGGCSALRIEADGMELARATDLERALEGVHLDFTPVLVAPESRNREVADWLADIALPKNATVHLGLDPAELESLPRTLPASWRALTLAPGKVHELGGGPVLELAAMAAQTAAALRKFGADAARHLCIELAFDTDAHIGTAKLRAARRMLATIVDAFGSEDKAVIHAVSSARMMQAQDPWMDIVRLCSAGFAAVAGGADYVMLRPFTEAMGASSPFAHRVSRNLQNLMLDESHLGAVRDPAAGSYWHESLSDRLAQRAWGNFQDIERRGGWEAYVAGGGLASDLEADRAARTDRPIVGVTLHPRPDTVPMPEMSDA